MKRTAAIAATAPTPAADPHRFFIGGTELTRLWDMDNAFADLKDQAEISIILLEGLKESGVQPEEASLLRFTLYDLSARISGLREAYETLSEEEGHK